ncbi:MAG TPA: winged helix-turn-helix transcriptional regulator [Acidobacteriota bacterium]|nr:winged helix-turn-helix transcriptional regulator [Acidobacteriota bacterium]
MQELGPRLGKWDEFFSYFKLLDETNAKILATMGEIGARSITNIANKTNLPVTTVRFRLEKMKKVGHVLVTANPNLPKLGLAKAIMVADSHLGRQEQLSKVIDNSAYWTYTIRCYGKHDGFCSYFAYPAAIKKELEGYIQEAKRLGAFSNFVFFWCTNSVVVPPDFSGYDFKERQWSFEWQRWARDVLTAPNEMPSALKEPADHSIMADKKDLLIIKELEKDESIGLNQLAKVVGISPQSVGSRYVEHISKRGLIVDYAVDISPYPPEFADLYLFKIDFTDKRSLGKFANAGRKKPFVISYSKIIDENSLLVSIYIIKVEFPNLIAWLNRLFIEKLIADFWYVTMDQSACKRQTISYELFEDGKWLYDSSEHIKRLHRILDS